MFQYFGDFDGNYELVHWDYLLAKRRLRHLSGRIPSRRRFKGNGRGKDNTPFLKGGKSSSYPGVFNPQMMAGGKGENRGRGKNNNKGQNRGNGNALDKDGNNMLCRECGSHSY